MAFSSTRARITDSNGKTLVNLSFPEFWDQYEITPELIAAVLKDGTVELNSSTQDSLSKYGAKRKRATTTTTTVEKDDIPF